MRELMTSSTLLMLGALVAAGAATFVVTLMLFPAAKHVHALGGYHDNSRAKALNDSRVLKLMWPLIELGAQYAAALKVPGWRASAQTLLREAGAPPDLDAGQPFCV